MFGFVRTHQAVFQNGSDIAVLPARSDSPIAPSTSPLALDVNSALDLNGCVLTSRSLFNLQLPSNMMLTRFCLFIFNSVFHGADFYFETDLLGSSSWT
jgi:hypothetical protein